MNCNVNAKSFMSVSFGDYCEALYSDFVPKVSAKIYQFTLMYYSNVSP